MPKPAANPHDRELSGLVGELTTRSEEFATRWAAQNVRLHISPAGTLKLGTSIRGDAFTRGKRAAAVARFLMYFARGAVRGMLRL